MQPSGMAVRCRKIFGMPPACSSKSTVNEPQWSLSNEQMSSAKWVT